MATVTEARAIGDDALEIVRVLDAPVALVFRLWESREHAIRWWGPKDFTCTLFEADFRPGGAWRAHMVSDQYGEGRMGGVYREIVREKRLVFTFAWDEGFGPPLDTIVTVTFEEKDGKTIQTFRQAPFTDVAVRDSHIGGWASFVEKEADYAEALAKEIAR